MVWNRGCTQSLVVNCTFWVVHLVSTRVWGYGQVILFLQDIDTMWALRRLESLVITIAFRSGQNQRGHQRSAFLAHCEGKILVTGGYPFPLMDIPCKGQIKQKAWDDIRLGWRHGQLTWMSWFKQGKSEGFESCDRPIVRKRPIWVKIGDVLYRVTLKFDGWPWKTIGHLSFAVSSFVQHFIAIG